MKFNVEFNISRLLLRLEHRAVELAVQGSLEKVLFPTGPASVNVPLHPLRLASPFFMIVRRHVQPKSIKKVEV